MVAFAVFPRSLRCVLVFRRQPYLKKGVGGFGIMDVTGNGPDVCADVRLEGPLIAGDGGHKEILYLCVPPVAVTVYWRL